MTHCDVRHEAGIRYRRVTRDVQRIANEVAPLVEEVTGLRLPPRPVIRVTKLAGCVVATDEDRSRILEEDIRELGLDEAEIAAARKANHARYRDDIRMSFLVAAVTIQSADKTPQVLFPVKSAHHAGGTGELLYQVMSHELTHVAQFLAGPWYMRKHSSHFADRYGLDLTAARLLREGHATWAHQQVTTRILGRAPKPGKPTWLHRRHKAKYAAVRQQRQVAYDDGSAFMAHINEATGGVTIINRVWADPRLAPTVQEFSDPASWLSRVGTAA